MDTYPTHTWMLRLAGIIPSKWSLRPTQDQSDRGVVDEWSVFRDLYDKGKLARLEEEDFKKFTDQFQRLANEVFQRAQIVAATPAMIAAEDFKQKTFTNIINDETSVTTVLETLATFTDIMSDETSVTTALETLAAWRSDETLILIGDDLQLDPPVFTGPADNPFFRHMTTFTFARFRDLHMPAFLLNEQMRMPAGMIINQ